MVQTSLVRNSSLVKPPTFTSVEAERRHRQERLAAALRVFAQFCFAPGLAGQAEAVGKPIPIDHDLALVIQRNGTHEAGWRGFQYLWDEITHNQPDLLD